MLAFWLVVAVVIGVLLLLAAWIDRRDRAQGRTPASPAEIAARARQKRRHERGKLIRVLRLWDPSEGRGDDSPGR